jgi:hypothetical protein
MANLHTASASSAAPGYVLIKRGSVTEISFWAWALKICYRPEHERRVKLVFRNGSWLPTDAGVDEVMSATASAMGIYAALERRDQAVGDRVYDSQDRIGSQDSAGQVPNSTFVTDVF